MNVTYGGWTYRLSDAEADSLKRASSPADVQKILGRAVIVARSRQVAA